MAPRRKIQVTPDEFLGYRPIPGYSKTGRLPDMPDGSYSIASRGRSARRFYNPALPVGDPRREIGDATYYQLRRRFQQSQAEDERVAAQRANERLKNFRIRQARNREIDRIQAEQSGMSTGEVSDIRREIAVYDYTHGIFQQDRQPGGYLATLLEELGWRPRGAPWMVGESGLDHSRTAPGINPAGAMVQWKSQSTTRGRVA